MSEEFKDFTATPTLTLNPVAEESAVPAMAQETRVQPNEAGCLCWKAIGSPGMRAT